MGYGSLVHLILPAGEYQLVQLQKIGGCNAFIIHCVLTYPVFHGYAHGEALRSGSPFQPCLLLCMDCSAEKSYLETVDTCQGSTASASGVKTTLENPRPASHTGCIASSRPTEHLERHIAKEDVKQTVHLTAYEPSPIFLLSKWASMIGVISFVHSPNRFTGQRYFEE